MKNKKNYQKLQRHSHKLLMLYLHLDTNTKSRTINCINNFVSPVEKINKEKLIHAFLENLITVLFDGLPISEEFRKLLALTLRKLGRMGIVDPNENSNKLYNYSRELTSQLTNSIKQQEHQRL